MFSKNLVRLRKQANLTQYELAERLGFSRGQIANYEQGKREPDYEILGIIADFFDVSIDDLLGRKTKQQDPSDDFDAFMFEDKEAFDALPDDVKQDLIKEINDKIEFLAYKQKNKDK